jgi:predicted O-methyltransferase YrrM
MDRAVRALSDLGQLSVAEARRLGELVATTDPARPIIEIGTLYGWSTMAICLFRPHGQRVVSVDNYSWNPLGFDPDTHQAVARSRLAALADVELVRADKTEFYATYTGPAPALVFADADHSYAETLADLRWARSVGAGIIAGHDYGPRFPGVVRAVDEMGGPAELVETLFVL